MKQNGEVRLQKAGGIAALVEAATFIFAIILMVAVIAPTGYGSLAVDPLENITFMAENQAILYVWNLVGYVIFGAFLVVLTLALHARLKDGAPGLMQVATAFGLIWAGLMFASGMVANIGAAQLVEVYGRDPAAAGNAWLSLRFVVDGLGGGNEIVGGLWVLLASVAALRSGVLPKALNILGVVVSLAGIVTLVPMLGDAGAVFGIGLIVWFAWLGIIMLRSRSSETAARAETVTPRQSVTS